MLHTYCEDLDGIPIFDTVPVVDEQLTLWPELDAQAQDALYDREPCESIAYTYDKDGRREVLPDPVGARILSRDVSAAFAKMPRVKDRGDAPGSDSLWSSRPSSDTSSMSSPDCVPGLHFSPPASSAHSPRTDTPVGTPEHLGSLPSPWIDEVFRGLDLGADDASEPGSPPSAMFACGGSGAGGLDAGLGEERGLFGAAAPEQQHALDELPMLGCLDSLDEEGFPHLQNMALLPTPPQSACAPAFPPDALGMLPPMSGFNAPAFAFTGAALGSAPPTDARPPVRAAPLMGGGPLASPSDFAATPLVASPAQSPVCAAVDMPPSPPVSPTVATSSRKGKRRATRKAVRDDDDDSDEFKAAITTTDDDADYVDDAPEPVPRKKQKRRPAPAAPKAKPRARGSAGASQDQGRYPCYFAPQGCKATFSRESDMKRHLQKSSLHPQVALQPGDARLLQVKQTHRGAFQCRACGKQLSRPDAVERHMRLKACGARKQLDRNYTRIQVTQEELQDALGSSNT
ncbi:hypothetical protein HDZ31DRAFT_76245 [Schizophyllum fasciatum]